MASEHSDYKEISGLIQAFGLPFHPPHRYILNTIQKCLKLNLYFMCCRPIGGTHGLSKYLDAIELVSVSLKRLSHEMDLAFDDMHGHF
jgi:hypothetical protein